MNQRNDQNILFRILRIRLVTAMMIVIASFWSQFLILKIRYFSENKFSVVFLIRVKCMDSSYGFVK
ncbi:hypothetical protein HanRHA438_Chr14g0648941 [Helianthus annuus]|nr:hypothetical protein HanIR_Chr14g0692811 [Helianthus annuus]KAJ0853248.1 hypothetical protein HanRHA438_Chr14g0648941 [Helianthus annuus]